MIEILTQFFKDNALYTILFILVIAGIIGVTAAIAVVKIKSRGQTDECETTNNSVAPTAES